jgi:2-amino-4-hydroxy-6-hydroxymethyldihydropteridine diphosphokinase
MTRHQAYIGLGSNQGNSREHILQAVTAFDGIRATQCLRVSSLYQSKAHGPSQPDYLNAVALLNTQLEPEELLDALQQIEQTHQRVREVHWGPRSLDLDILLFDQLIITSDRLTLPHPFMTQRNFVLIPLAEIEPELILPDGRPLTEVIHACQDAPVLKLTSELTN